MVNTASACGFTPQLGALEQLYKTIRSTSPHGGDFEIVGFPCNQFGGQDPGSNETIQEFCQLNYGVTFPVLGKTDVNGPNAEPVWEWMKAEQPGVMGLKRVIWNFSKMVVARDGTCVGRWAPTAKPESLREVIERELMVGHENEVARKGSVDGKM